MQRTIHATVAACGLVALIGTLALLACPAMAEAKGGAKTPEETSLIAFGAGYTAPQGSAPVRTIQHRLRRAGEGPGPVDGRYGPLTEAAVERFQAGHGLVADGIVGPATESALRHRPGLIALGAGYGNPQGSARVRTLQRRLHRAGERPGPLDGRFGPLTAAAVEHFQAREGLVADGVVGEATSGTLARAVAPSSKAREAPVARPEGLSAKPKPAKSAAALARQGEPARIDNAQATRHHQAPTFPAWLAWSMIGLAWGGVLALALTRRADSPARRRSKPAGLFQVRIVGRGGQGVVTAAELLSVAAVAEGRHGQALPTFGFDGIGAAMSFCRIGDRPIRAREPIGPPNGVIVLDPAVLHQVDLSSWLGSDGYALINSKRTLEELGLRELAATLPEDRCLTIPAVELAHGQAGGSLPNASLLGGFAALSEAVSLPSLEGAIRKRFPGPIGDANIVAAEAAFEYVENRLNGRATKVRSTSSPPRRRLSTSRIGSMAELRRAQRPSYEGKEASTR